MMPSTTPPTTPDESADANASTTRPDIASTASVFIAQHRSITKTVSSDYISVSFRKHNGQVGDRRSNAHQLHWYPAKLFYRIPIDILEALELPPRSIVVDPFCGSGTVLVESRLRNHMAIGLDINPLSRLISKVKTTTLDQATATNYLSTICNKAKSLRRTPSPEILSSFWFRTPARNALYRLLEAIHVHDLSPPYRDFFLATLSSIVRRCSLADPNIPPLVRLREDRIEIAGPRYRRAYEHAMALATADVYTAFSRVAAQNIHLVSRENEATHSLPEAKVYPRSALDSRLASDSVDLVITSPPYCGAQKYVRTFKLELGLLGLTQAQIRAIDGQTLGTEGVTKAIAQKPAWLSKEQQKLLLAVEKRDTRRAVVLATYLAGLEKFAYELSRILRPNGTAFLTFGTSRFSGIEIDLASDFSKFAHRAGITTLARLQDRIPSRGMITKRHESASVIPTENILWLRKHRD